MAMRDFLDNEVYLGHVRQARDFARSVVCWMLNYLAHVADVVESLKSHPVGVPSRADLLKSLDVDSIHSIPTIRQVLRRLPSEFPCVQDWLMS
jgi:hypothetical protein